MNLAVLTTWNIVTHDNKCFNMPSWDEHRLIFFILLLYGMTRSGCLLLVITSTSLSYMSIISCLPMNCSNPYLSVNRRMLSANARITSISLHFSTRITANPRDNSQALRALLIISCFPMNYSIQKESLEQAQGFFSHTAIRSNPYLFENCGARRAAFKPYFLRSFIRGSLVRKPADFKTGL